MGDGRGTGGLFALVLGGFKTEHFVVIMFKNVGS